MHINWRATTKEPYPVQHPVEHPESKKTDKQWHPLPLYSSSQLYSRLHLKPKLSAMVFPSGGSCAWSPHRKIFNGNMPKNKQRNSPEFFKEIAHWRVARRRQGKWTKSRQSYKRMLTTKRTYCEWEKDREHNFINIIWTLFVKLDLKPSKNKIQILQFFIKELE